MAERRDVEYLRGYKLILFRPMPLSLSLFLSLSFFLSLSQAERRIYVLF